MAPKPEIPDPSKTMDQPIEDADTPQIIIPHEESEDSDNDNPDEEVEFGPMTGYQLLPQENNNYDDNQDEEDDDDDGLSMQEKIAALMQQSQGALEEWNISDSTKSLVDESKATQAKQEADEQAEIWKTGEKVRDINVDTEKVEKIKSVMANIKLPGTIPQWAMEGKDVAWKDKLLEKVNTKKL